MKQDLNNEIERVEEQEPECVEKQEPKRAPKHDTKSGKAYGKCRTDKSRSDKMY